jgi:hypothetical protein
MLDPILHWYGFEFHWGGSGPSSAGIFAFGAYVSGNRKLELHYRHSLGLGRTISMNSRWPMIPI